MILNREQSMQINDFIMKYNNDEKFREYTQRLYYENIYRLPILHIYALEEILRDGSLGMFDKFLKVKGEELDSQAVESYEKFMNLMRSDVTFNEYKIAQLHSEEGFLSNIELFAFELMSISNDFENTITESLTKKKEEMKSKFHNDHIVEKPGFINYSSLDELKVFCDKYSEGDKDLSETLYLLNTNGFRTTACCKGHEDEDGRGYIAFQILPEYEAKYKSIALSLISIPECEVEIGTQ